MARKPTSDDPKTRRKSRQRRPQAGDVVLGVFDGGKAEAGAGDERRPPPELAADFPEPPVGLDDEGRRCWRHHAAILDVDGRFDRGRDLHTLAAFCLAWSRLVAAERLVADEGLVVETADGGSKKHPAVTIANEATTQVKHYANELGLTPAARKRLPETGAKTERDERKATARRLLD